MSYYDGTVASYDSQISSNSVRIDECNASIKQYEDDIADLKQLRVRVFKVDEAVDTANSSTSNKINNLPSVITNPLSILKLNYFSKFFDVISGSSCKRAKSSISDSYTKIDAKIRELENNIQNLKNEINQCNSNITSLRQQRSSYISNMERKIAEEKAAREKAEAAAREAAAREAATKQSQQKAVSASASKQTTKSSKSNAKASVSVQSITKAVTNLLKKK